MSVNIHHFQSKLYEFRQTNKELSILEEIIAIQNNYVLWGRLLISKSLNFNRFFQIKRG